MKKYSNGFTVIELLFIVVVLAAASVLFFMQKNNVEAASRDETRKISINALYYSLEEVFFKKNGYYPVAIDAETLPSVDPSLFTDPEGVAIGEGDSDYRYDSTNCDDDRCKSYTLRTSLENEADYIKESNNS